MHRRLFPDHRILFGFDANAGYKRTEGWLSAEELVEWYKSQGLSTHCGEIFAQYGCTTYNARTFLQPQLNKAIKLRRLALTLLLRYILTLTSAD